MRIHQIEWQPASLCSYDGMEGSVEASAGGGGIGGGNGVGGASGNGVGNDGGGGGLGSGGFGVIDSPGFTGAAAAVAGTLALAGAPEIAAALGISLGAMQVVEAITESQAAAGAFNNMSAPDAAALAGLQNGGST